MLHDRAEEDSWQWSRVCRQIWDCSLQRKWFSAVQVHFHKFHSLLFHFIISDVLLNLFNKLEHQQLMGRNGGKEQDVVKKFDNFESSNSEVGIEVDSPSSRRRIKWTMTICYLFHSNCVTNDLKINKCYHSYIFINIFTKCISSDDKVLSMKNALFFSLTSPQPQLDFLCDSSLVRGVK